MKAGEIREMNLKEMEDKILFLKEYLFNLRFQHKIGQLENTGKLKETRRDIARIKTIMAENAKNSQN